ncbi:MAG: YndJ family transporter [Actinomycetota bacterium]
MALTEVVVVGGALVVLPLALRVAAWPVFVVVAGFAAASLQLSEGALAGVLAVPWPVATALAAVGALRAAARRHGVRLAAAPWIALETAPSAYACVAGLAVVQSRLGLSLAGVHEPLVLLTAVHFTFAGAGASAIAGAARRLAPARTGLATVGAALVVGAPPVVALGFVTGAAWPQVGGALLLTGGVYAVAVVQLTTAPAQRWLVRALLVVSSLGVLAAMPLGVAWAAAQHWPEVPAMSIPDLVRTHGMLNGVLFVPCGLVGWRLLERGVGRMRREAVA